MYSLYNKIKNFIFPKEYHALMLGFGNQGIESVFYRLNFSSGGPFVPWYILLNHNFEYKNIVLQPMIMDDKIQGIIKNYLNFVKGLIFVIDVNETSNYFQAASEVIHQILQDSASNDIIFLFYIYQKDVSNTSYERDLERTLNLDQISGGRWKIQNIAETTGEGLIEGLEWLYNQINNI